MKVIAITQRVDIIEQYEEKRDALDQRWYDLLGQCGLLPILFPNDLSTAQALLEKIKLEGIILTGGNNTPERQQVERLLLNKAISEHLPLLGICHGMQQIQQHFNVPLEKVTQHVTEKQTILIDEKSETVNSYHDWGTRQTVPELKVWAKAPDGIIKAIQHTELPITGIMWHPERITPFSTRDLLLIKKIFYGTVT